MKDVIGNWSQANYWPLSWYCHLEMESPIPPYMDIYQDTTYYIFWKEKRIVAPEVYEDVVKF